MLNCKVLAFLPHTTHSPDVVANAKEIPVDKKRLMLKNKVDKKAD